jgi:hypothetical protein
MSQKLSPRTRERTNINLTNGGEKSQDQRNISAAVGVPKKNTKGKTTKLCLPSNKKMCLPKIKTFEAGIAN